MATVTMKAPAPAGLSNKARELMEAINTDAGKDNIWVRTQMNAPAQQAWFSQTRRRRRRPMASGRVAIGQMKSAPYRWRWKEYKAYLDRLSRIAAQGRRAADRVRRPADHPAHQSRPRRPPAGDQHHPLRDLDLQSGRHRARARALARTPAAPSCPTRAATPIVEGERCESRPAATSS